MIPRGQIPPQFVAPPTHPHPLTHTIKPKPSLTTHPSPAPPHAPRRCAHPLSIHPTTRPMLTHPSCSPTAPADRPAAVASEVDIHYRYIVGGVELLVRRPDQLLHRAMWVGAHLDTPGLGVASWVPTVAAQMASGCSLDRTRLQGGEEAAFRRKFGFWRPPSCRAGTRRWPRGRARPTSRRTLE